MVLSNFHINMRKAHITLLILFFAFAFYWIFVRPIIAKQSCNKTAIEQATENKPLYIPIKDRDRGYIKSEYEEFYKSCIRESGLN